MTQQQLNQLLDLITSTPNKTDTNELSAIVLKMATDSITLDRLKSLICLETNNPLLIDNGNTKNKENGSSVKSENMQSNVIKFTTKEVKRMEKTFKKHFILNGYIAHVTKRQSGKKGFYYQIRYRRNGYNVEASSVNLQEAKRKFLEKTKPENIGKYLVKKMKSGFNLLEEIFEEWHAYKKGTRWSTRNICALR